ncbi:MAG TPA: hypothetical protein PK581_04975, partial [Caldisericia bacterium]|nr:hypothetical protein [Caldisericia bacterium]
MVTDLTHVSRFGKDCGDKGMRSYSTVECSIASCVNLLDSNGNLKDYEATEYNCKFISCCFHLWEKTAKEWEQKSDEYLERSHELAVYDRNEAMRFLLLALEAIQKAQAYNHFASLAAYWLIDNSLDCILYL